MIRISSYTILSDPLPGGGYALMNSHSGAMDLIADEIALALVRHGRFNGMMGNAHFPNLRDEQKEELMNTDQSLEPDNQFPFTEELIENYLQRGYLTNLTHREEKKIVYKLSEELHKVHKANPGFMIVPSFDCNYRCTYCYEKPIQNELLSKNGLVSYSKNNVTLTSRQIDAIYESIGKIKASHNCTSEGGDISLYGGEPLDGSNKKIVSEIIEKGIDRGYCFSAITNGHDIADFFSFFEKGVIKHIQVTIDGPKRIHDKRRIHIKGESSFDKIITNIKKVAELQNTDVLIRVHIDENNIEYFSELIDNLDKAGLCNNPYITIYCNPVYKKNSDQSIYTDISKSGIMERLSDMQKKFSNVIVNSYVSYKINKIFPAIADNKPYQIESLTCSANSGLYIFAPDGNIYACWETLGKEESKIGTFSDSAGVEYFEEKFEYWINRHAGSIKECLNCPYCLICGGGCSQYAEYNNGTIYSPFCENFDVNFKSILSDSIDEICELSQSTFV